MGGSETCQGTAVFVPQPRADLFRPGLCSTRAGHSPPSVLGGIQLSSLPWSGAGASTTTFGLALHGSAVSPRFHRSRDCSFIAFGEAGLVSVPSPTVSGYASQRHASCSEGGTSPGGPRGPRTGSRRAEVRPELLYPLLLGEILAEELPLELADLVLRVRLAVLLEGIGVERQEGRAPLVYREEPLGVLLLSQDVEGRGDGL